MQTPNTNSVNTKCGFVAILGRPNAGKSTLLNKIIGEKMAAVSPKAQTTRKRFRGILSTDDTQVIFVDTPGLHVAPEGKSLNQYCVAEALDVLEDSDIYLYLIDGSRLFEGDRPGTDEHFVIEVLEKALAKNPKPLIVGVTKMDIWEKGTGSFASQATLQDTLKRLPVKAIVPISAKKPATIENLVDLIRADLPHGPKLFPDEDLTDQNMRQIVGELVQEQLFLLLGELPYSCAVEVVNYKDPDDTHRMPEIDVNIHVERDSQKPMVIGKGGAKIKEISHNARENIEKLLGSRVVLRVFVKVTPKWTRDTEHMRRLGYVVPTGTDKAERTHR